MEFNMDKSFIFTCLITLFLINVVTYRWKKNTKSLRIMRRFTIYTFTSQIIYLFIFFVIILIVLVLNKDYDFLGWLTSCLIFTTLLWRFIVITFLNPYQNINKAFRFKLIDLSVSRKLKGLVFLPLIFAILTGSYIATLSTEKPFSLKFPEIGNHSDIDIPKISITKIGRDSLILSSKFVIRTNIEEPMIISCRKGAFYTKFSYYSMQWRIMNQPSPYIVLRKNEPLYLEIQTSEHQDNIKKFLAFGIKGYSLRFITIDEKRFELY
jgi:hypothetical protein